MNIEILLVCIAICFCCTLPGNFLILRGASMLTDAVSHTVLLGIVIGYFIANDLSSPLLLVFAILMGIVTVWVVELLSSTKLLNKDTSIGVTFPFFFSLAVILISKFAKNTHLDVEHIIFGELALVPFDRFETVNYDFGPKALIYALIIFCINLIIIMLFYRELKISSFDNDYAISIGIPVVFINYLLMTIVSITTVVSFRSVGVVLVIAFIVGPPMTARLLTNKLSFMIFLSAIIGCIDIIIGYFFAVLFDVSIAGMQSTVIGIVFLLVLFVKKRLIS